MLNTVLGLPKKGISALPQAYPSKREKPTPITTNAAAEHETGKRLFESGTYKDPRLIYDVSNSIGIFDLIIDLFRVQREKRKRNNLSKHLCDTFDRSSVQFISFSSVIGQSNSYSCR